LNDEAHKEWDVQLQLARRELLRWAERIRREVFMKKSHLSGTLYSLSAKRI
jgi:hypothetical protein